MLHVAHPKILISPRRLRPPARAWTRAAIRAPRAESLAPPLTLAAIVLCALASAVTTAVLGAFGAQ